MRASEEAAIITSLPPQPPFSLAVARSLGFSFSCARASLALHSNTIAQDQIAFLVKREKYTLADFQEGLKQGIDKAVSVGLAQRKKSVGDAKQLTRVH